MKIPKKYCKGRHPTAGTVGELKKLLAELPDELPVRETWGKAPELVVYNYGLSDMHLQFCEPHEDEEEE